jgi:hypothetical protein
MSLLFSTRLRRRDSGLVWAAPANTAGEPVFARGQPPWLALGVALVEYLVAQTDFPRWLSRTRPVLSGGAGPVLARGSLAVNAVDPQRIGRRGVIELDPPPMPRGIGEVEVVRLLLVAHGGSLPRGGFFRTRFAPTG